jgi:signal transduction histidine kinase
MRLPRLHSIRNRLLLLFFAITAAAIVFVYLYVVPQLQSNLTAQKLRRLEAVATVQGRVLAAEVRRDSSPARLQRVLTAIAQRADARVTVLGVRPGPGGTEPAPSFVVDDSQLDSTAILPRYAAAGTAVTTRRSTAGVERVGGVRIGEVAVPISRSGQVRWVAVFSSSLAEVEDNVALIRRQILIAGGIALGAALLAGFFAARATSQRLRRLERAAQQVAEGDFNVAIPVDSSDEVGELARAFNEMQRRLASLDLARKEFIANASHELRTPIFSLGGFVELLAEANPDEAARKEFVQTMREQVARLTKLTTDLLDLSKLDSDAIEISSEEVDLAELAESLASEFRPVAKDHHSRLELRSGDEPPVARADPGRVGQILRILLDNAFTHTPEGTAVTVTTLHQNGAAELIVSDEGPGIAPRVRERVFERFYTGDSAAGSGLGLAIAQELAGRMGGHLGLTSSKGFTAFTLALPTGSGGSRRTRRRTGARA